MTAATTGGPVSAAPRSFRAKVQSAGLSGNHWYPACEERDLPPGAAREVVFWNDSIAVFRGADGTLGALENRCAHRQIRLSEGKVEGNLLTCRYHGWRYDCAGKLASVRHDLGGKKLPSVWVRSYPVRARYGLVWIFPGDPALAETVPLPTIRQLETPGERWDRCPIRMTLKSHHSMVIENVCDFNHEMLHDGKSPFLGQKMISHGREGDAVRVRYETSIGRSGLVKYFASGERSGSIELWYDYPYQGSNTDDKYVHWLFVRPIDEQTSECFFLFLFKEFTIPGTERPLPALLRAPLLAIARKLYIEPVLAQDRWALEEEQRQHALHAEKPSAEVNPIIPLFRKLTWEKWQAWLESETARHARPADAAAPALPDVEARA